MTDEKRIDERVEALSDDELEGASGGKRIEVVDAGFDGVNPKGIWAESAAPMSDSEGPTTILIWDPFNRSDPRTRRAPASDDSDAGARFLSIAHSGAQTLMPAGAPQAS